MDKNSYLCVCNRETYASFIITTPTMEQTIIDKLLFRYINKSVWIEKFMTPLRSGGYVFATDLNNAIIVNADAIDNGNYPEYPEELLPEKFRDLMECDYTVRLDDVEAAIACVPLVDQIVPVGNDVCCDECDGDGYVSWSYTDKAGYLHNCNHHCPVCDGTGLMERVTMMKSGDKVPDPEYHITVLGYEVQVNSLVLMRDTMKLLGIDSCRLSIKDSHHAGQVIYTPDVTGRFIPKLGDNNPSHSFIRLNTARIKR